MKVEMIFSFESFNFSGKGLKGPAFSTALIDPRSRMSWPEGLIILISSSLPSLPSEKQRVNSPSILFFFAIAGYCQAVFIFCFR